MNSVSKIAFLTLQANYPIRARVLSKGTIHRRHRGPNGVDHLELIIDDDTGSIYAEVTGPYLEVIDEMIKSDFTYIFNGYLVKPASCEGHASRNSLEISVTRPSHVFECKDMEPLHLDTIGQLFGHQLFSPLERFYRNMQLYMTDVFLRDSTYLGCPDDNCRKAILHGDENDLFYCNRGCRVTWNRRVARYRLRVRFMDASGTLDAICFDEAGFIFTKMTAEEFRDLAIKQPQRLRGRANNVVNRMYDVRIQKKLDLFPFPPYRQFTFIIQDIKLA